MPFKNDAINVHSFLQDMYSDGYFPDFLVDKIRSILLDLCAAIEANQPADEPALLKLTHAATERINELEEEFEEHDSELETEAREAMGADFEYIVRSYGFSEVDIEDVIAPREW